MKITAEWTVGRDLRLGLFQRQMGARACAAKFGQFRISHCQIVIATEEQTAHGPGQARYIACWKRVPRELTSAPSPPERGQCRRRRGLLVLMRIRVMAETVGMPIQSVEYYEEKAWLADEAARTMNTPAAKAAMLQIAELYRKLAEQTRKLKEAGGSD